MALGYYGLPLERPNMKRALWLAALLVGAAATTTQAQLPRPGTTYPASKVRVTTGGGSTDLQSWIDSTSVVPGVSGDIGNDATLGYISTMQTFQGLRASSFQQRKWVDPYFGDDANPGTYLQPFKSFADLSSWQREVLEVGG